MSDYVNVICHRPENLFTIQLPMTDIETATTMDKIVTQIKTRFKVSTNCPSSLFWLQNSVIILILIDDV